MDLSAKIVIIILQNPIFLMFDRVLNIYLQSILVDSKLVCTFFINIFDSSPGAEP